MNDETYDAIRVKKESEKLGHIVLARPDEMNTFSVEMAEEIKSAIETLEADDAVAGIVITGDGPAFSAGANITDSGDNDSEDLNRQGIESSRRGQEIFGQLRDSPLPIVAAVDGFALGAGMEFTMCADLRVASERSKFGLPEHDLGLLPGWGGTARLQQLVGESVAKYMIFSADQFPAERMREWGFVHEVYPDEDFEEMAMEFAQSIAEGPPIARKYTKRTIHAAGENLDAGLEMEASALGHLLDTEDVAEGAAAFAEDRDPEFSGK